VKIALLSDIHSNLQALLAVEKKIDKLSPDKVIFLGDIVGYGARPGDCIDIVKKNAWQGICGNHDQAASKDTDLVLFNPYAKEAIRWTRQNLDPKQKEYLDSLELTYSGEGFILSHSSLFEPEKFHYLDNYGALYKDFSLLAERGLQVSFVAHTHIAGTFVYKGDNLYRDHSKRIEMSPQYRYVINIGSVGQPRDRDPRSCFCIFDTTKRRLEFIRVDYDIQESQEDILSKGLPPILANRLEGGW
jgi:diadenosine tetraphosphatase ApaH/serine/threonine PP2A family protein phosphatase